MRCTKEVLAVLVAAALVVTTVAASFHASSDAHVLPNGDAPITEEGWDEVNGNPDGVPVFEIEGTITAVDAEARRLTVNGVPLNVPATLNVDVGDPDAPSGQEITWECFTRGECAVNATVSSPVGWTAIAHGSMETLRVDGEPRIRVHLEHLFVERAENVIAGVVTRNEAGDGFDPDRIWVNGIPAVMETDPRFAAFNSITDAAGQAITLADLHEGAPVGIEGYFDPATGLLHARHVEADFVHLEDGETDAVVITRAEGRDRGDDRENELRVSGEASDASETITLYGDVDGEESRKLLATGVPVSPDDGTWTFRTRDLGEDEIITHVYAESTGGGTDDAAVTYR